MFVDFSLSIQILRYLMADLFFAVYNDDVLGRSVSEIIIGGYGSLILVFEDRGGSV